MLGIPPAAVRNQVSEILKKMDTQSRTVAAVTAIKRDLCSRLGLTINR
jgi:DNA-binding NarL/FixJ family response regulator